MKTPELAEAFLLTTYRVEADEGAFELRIGEASPAFSSWVRQQRASCWGIITACNPGGRLTPDPNGIRMRDLLERIGELGWRHVPSRNCANAGDWPEEPGFCVLDVGLQELRVLAEEFGQEAIVYGGVDGMGGVVWLEEMRT